MYKTLTIFLTVFLGSAVTSFSQDNSFGKPLVSPNYNVNPVDFSKSGGSNQLSQVKTNAPRVISPEEQSLLNIQRQYKAQGNQQKVQELDFQLDKVRGTTVTRS